jgi:3-phenylpropionate/trans-cinnamate dioxygenase ferredoxin reductase subunit
MLGHDRPHEDVPYFFSDLGDWASIEYVGPAESYDEEVVRGAGSEFAVWFLEGGRLRGHLSVGGAGDLERARELLLSGEPVGAGAL